MADNSVINFLKYYLQKLKSFFLSKDILSFLFFLALSSAFWFVHSLGKEHETTITIPVRYVGLPINYAITNSPPREITVNIKDQGVKLFYYQSNHQSPISIDLSRNFYQKGEILITSDQLGGRISRYMHLQSTTTILEVHPDSLLIQYERLSVKTLPIKLISKIELAPQYMLSEGIRLEPSEVTVFGEKKLLNSLKSIPTELLELKNVNDTAMYKCKLKLNDRLQYSAKYTRVSIFVEPFTERKVQIPITNINCPDNLSIRAFPAFVTATYKVGLSQFNTFSPDDIQIYLDYNDLKSSSQSKQMLRIKNNSSHISNIRISPQEVEFVLEQK
ncbi:MAG: hypothetical protein P4L34_11940 [Paludibacter sp.]|nr:hypothetical protein [Paludibacter sp.]